MKWILLLALWTEYDTSLVKSENPEKLFNASICDNIRVFFIDKSLNTPKDNATISVCYSSSRLYDTDIQYPFKIFIGLAWKIKLPK